MNLQEGRILLHRVSRHDDKFGGSHERLEAEVGAKKIIVWEWGSAPPLAIGRMDHGLMNE